MYFFVKEPLCRHKPDNHSGSGVVFFVDCAEAVLVDMGVDLCGFNVGVSEHFLQGSQIHAAGKQVGGETVPQGVDGQALGHAGAKGVFFDDAPQFYAVQSPAGT